MSQIVYPESDWKLFSKKYYEWNERYLDSKIYEYKKLLDSDDTSSEKFELLQEKINADRRSPIIRLPRRFSRSNMFINIIALVESGAISYDDLSEFSAGLQKDVKSLIQIRSI
jgi:hypothetical protein